MLTWFWGEPKSKQELDPHVSYADIIEVFGAIEQLLSTNIAFSEVKVHSVRLETESHP